MSFISNPKPVRSDLYALLGFYLFSIFLLAIAWEFELEPLASAAFGLALRRPL